MRRRKTWLLIGIVVVLAAFLVPWRAAADKIGVLVNGTFYLDIGTLLSGSGITGITVANEASDTENFPVFVTAATGALGPKSNTGLKFDSSTGVLLATGYKGTVTSHAATEAATAATMYGQTHLVTGAYTVTLPTAVAGMSATFCATTAAVFSLDLQATDYWVLNGTTLTQANKVSSSGFAGECISFVSTATNYYRSTMINGTMIDGGA